MPKKITTSDTPGGNPEQEPEKLHDFDDSNMPPPIPTGYQLNFDTLMRAAMHNAVCIMHVFERDENGVPDPDRTAVLVAAVNHRPSGEVEFVPLARMLDGNPYGQFAAHRNSPRVDRDSGEEIPPS